MFILDNNKHKQQSGGMFGFLRHFFKLQFLLILIAMLWGIYYPEILTHLKTRIFPDASEPQSESSASADPSRATQLFTKQELAKFDGEDGAPLYLALLGSVYDVSKGRKHYGSGCSYNFFVGRDASVSFVTGQFDNYDEESADDVISLKPNDLLSLDNWRKFYAKDYTYVGKVIGRFYDDAGTPTTYYHKFEALVQQAHEMKQAAEQLRELYPDCNIEWSEEKGTRVWCTPTSGGKQRNWAGYPRKLYEMGKDFRCACIREEELDTTAVMLRPYDNCQRLASECFYRV